MFVAMPSGEARKSAKRRFSYSKRSRITSKVHRSPTTSSAPPMGHLDRRRAEPADPLDGRFAIPSSLPLTCILQVTWIGSRIDLHCASRPRGESPMFPAAHTLLAEFDAEC